MRPLAILSLLPSLPGLAQVQWGGVHGVISDPAGAAIPGAYIAATSNTLPRGITTFSDERGSYVLPALPVGSYTITVAAPGFHSLLYHISKFDWAFNSRLTRRCRSALLPTRSK